MNSPKIRRALISVSDKTGLIDFAQRLVAAGIEIVSSGGTQRLLSEEGIAAEEVSDYTNFPEMLDGRLKTLHPKVHGGILCRRDREDDMASLARHDILPFELVVVNLYPFEQTISRKDVTLVAAIEKIDIGGPTLVRAAAKNHAFVTIATDPRQYGQIAQQIETDGTTTAALRQQLAGEAFARTAAYDTAIAGYFVGLQATSVSLASSGSGDPPRDDLFAARPNIDLERRALLRYGENPHQSAALYATCPTGSVELQPPTLATAEQLHGKELSFNNYLDLDGAWATVRSLPGKAAAVIKHSNPCGAASADSLGEAIRNAWEGDPISAFGSVLAFNATVDQAVAAFLCEPGKFVEAIVAPNFDPAAIELLTSKPKWKTNVRLVKIGAVPPGSAANAWRQIDGGLLCQQADDLPDDTSTWKVVTRSVPTDGLRGDLEFAWAAVRHVKSNAIVLVRDRALVGVGAGQMSRVDAVEIAIRKAGDKARGAVLASDAFFPFDDSIHAAAAAGVAAVIEPGGSRRDDEVIAACNEHNISMLFTGRRHFRH